MDVIKLEGKYEKSDSKILIGTLTLEMWEIKIICTKNKEKTIN